MIGKTTRLVIGGMLCVILAGWSTAGAGTIQDAFDKAFKDPDTPIILEDEDKQFLVDTDGSGGPSVSDFIYGVIRIQYIDRAEYATPPGLIRNVGPEGGGNITQLGLGASGENSLTGIFGVHIQAIVQGPLPGQWDIIVEPLAGFNTDYISGLGAGFWDIPTGPGGDGVYYTADDQVVTYQRQGPAGTVFDLYEDGPGVAGGGTAYNTTSRALGVSTATDGTWQLSAGFTQPAAPPQLYASNNADEFFYNRDTDGDGTPDEFEFNLNKTADPGSGPFAAMGKNDIVGPTPPSPPPGSYGIDGSWGAGASIYGEGSLDPIGPPWDRLSDGNYKILVPVPAAIFPGAALLAALGVFRIVRRRKLA